MNDRAATVAEYLRFSRDFARGVSDRYADLTEAAAGSELVLAFLGDLPPPKRQPNLLLAALKYHFGVPADGAELEQRIAEDGAVLRATMLARATQTNEPARCAALLPVFSRLQGPLALLEPGAAAGLCLLPDRYGYDYNGQPVGAAGVVFPCRANPETPVPERLPEVVWRRGMDLNPLDIGDDSVTQWLDALIWPGQEARAARFRAAVDIARRDPPEVVPGDLLSDLERVAGEAPTGAHLVVFHTTVLMYVRDMADRKRFADMVRDIGATWVMNEDPELFPDIAAKAPPPPGPGRLLLSVNAEPVAWTQPHGQSIDWFAKGGPS